jgi:enamine deaminase RidA (YjgF/YER057c/UK114 family)
MSAAGAAGRADPLARLAELGLELPAVAAPLAAYVPAVEANGFVFTAGQLPFVDGALPATGLVGDGAGSVAPEMAADLAARCALNGLAAVHALGRLVPGIRVVKVTGFVASAPGFVGQPAVVDGASRLLGDVFGDGVTAGRHARSAVGVAALPLNSPVEVELTLALP